MTAPRFHAGGAPLVNGPQQLTTMAPFLREATVNRETASALLDPLSAAQLAWRPADGGWSLAQVCGHMARATGLYLPRLDAAIEAAHARGAYSDAPLRGTLLGRLLVWSMEPPPRFRMKTFASMTPLDERGPERLRADYLATQEAFRLRLERAAGLDLAHVRVRLPEFPVVRLALDSVLAFLLAHERRHLWQATSIRQAVGFPMG